MHNRVVLAFTAVALVALALLAAVPSVAAPVVSAYQVPSPTINAGTPTVTPRACPEGGCPGSAPAQATASGPTKTPRGFVASPTAKPSATATPTITPTPSQTLTPSTTPTMRATATASRTPTITASPTPTPILIRDGSFEREDGWTLEAGAVILDLEQQAFDGTKYVYISGSSQRNGRIRQTFTIRPELPTLTFWSRVSSYQTSCELDRGLVKVNGATVAMINDFCESRDDPLAWRRIDVDLRAYAGQTVEVLLQLEAGLESLSAWRIDMVVDNPALP